MKKYIPYLIAALIIGAIFSFEGRSSKQKLRDEIIKDLQWQGWAPLRIYNLKGEISSDNAKILRDTATITNGSGAVIDISKVGFTAPPAVQAIAVKNTADSMQVPNVAIKSVTTSQVVLNVTEANVGAYVEVNGLGLGLIKVMQAGASPIKFVRTPTIIHLQCTGK